VAAEGPDEGVAYRVTGIVSAVISLFRDVTAHFQERYPDSGKLAQYPVDDALSPEALQPIIARVYAGDRGVQRLLDIYDRHGDVLPVGALASGLGGPVWRAYATLVSRPGRHLFTEAPDPALARGSVAAAGAGPLVLTRTAIATVEELTAAGHPIRPALARSGRRLVAPRSLVDELEEELADLRAYDGQPMRTMSTGPAGLALHEASPDAVAALTDRRRATAAWLGGTAEILPRPLAEIGVAGRARRERLGASSADALSLANAEAGALWADDLGLRRIEAPAGSVAGCSTWALVEALGAEGHLTAEAVHRATLALLRLRHHFVPVGAELLYRALRDEAYAVGADTILALDQLSGTEVTVDSATSVVAEFLRLVALDPLGAGALRPVTLVCLERITRGHLIEVTLRALGRKVGHVLGLLPNAASVVEDCMQRFRAAQVVSRSLR
jgi:hypothetical protein